MKIRRWITALLLVLSGASATAERSVAVRALPQEDWTPDGPVTAHIIGLHSFGDYHKAFSHLGPWFAERGYAVHAFDQRGFGATADHGHWAGTARMVDDAIARARQLKAEGAESIYLMGESMGGAVAMLAAVREPALIDGLILAAPAVREGIWIRYLYNVGLSVVAAVAPGATQEVERDPDDPHLYPPTARRLARDPLVVSQVRMDTWRGMITLADRASNRAAAIADPVLLMFGGRDETIPPVSIDRLRQHLDDRVSWRFYEKGPHLLLQSRDWQSQARDIVHWLESRIPKPQQARLR